VKRENRYKQTKKKKLI